MRSLLKYIQLIQFRIVMLTFLLWGVSFAQDETTRPISLEDALTIGHRSAYAVKLAKARLSEASGRSLEAWSGFLPSLTISENFVRSTDPVSVFGLKLKQGVFSESDFLLPALNDPDEFENYTTAVTLKQPLINLDAIFGKAAVSKLVRARKHSVKRAEQALEHHIRKAYYGLILSKKSVQAIRSSLKSAQAHRDNAESGFDQGMITRADYLSAQVRVLELQEQLIVAENQMLQVSDGLKVILGLSEGTQLLIPTDTLMAAAGAADVPESDLFPVNRADLLAIQYQKEAAVWQNWAGRSAWFPRINGYAAREWNADTAFQDDSNNWTVGVQLSWNLFDGLGHWGRAKQAAAQLRQAEVQYDQARHQAGTEVAKARRDIDAARKRINVARLAVEQARESLMLTEERYNEGLEKTSDLLEKESSLTQARLRLLKARHDYAIAISDLDFAMGIQSKPKTEE